MLPYETERHAKAIFARLITGWFTHKGTTPSEIDTTVFAEAAVRMAQEFSTVADHFARPPAGVRTGHLQTRQSLTFEQLVHEWQRHALRHWEKRDKRKVLSRFQRYLFPSLESRPAEEIKPSEFVAALRAVEDAGFLPLAHLILRDTTRLYRFAIASGFALNNPAADVRGALYPWRPKRRATILLPKRIGELLRAIDGYNGYTTSKYMLRLLPLVFVRPSELREAEWAEIDFKGSEWRIPARRMKARRPHIVPLSKQAKVLFRQVHRMTGHGVYVFASSSSKSGFISEHLSTSMLKSIGFGGEMTMSGFRSMAATLLSEQGWNSDAIERQLSHVDPRPIRRTYNFAQYLPERRRMMQTWADYLDELAGRHTRATETHPSRATIAATASRLIPRSMR